MVSFFGMILYLADLSATLLNNSIARFGLGDVMRIWL
jgi:hypothetical protein